MPTREEIAVFCETYEAVESAVDRAVATRNKLIREVLPREVWDAYIWHEGTITDVSTRCVTVDWDVYGYRGSHESGTDYIPLEALYDDTFEEFITDDVNKTFEVVKAAQARKRTAEAESKVATIKRLQAELDALIQNGETNV
jgi:hypothetical protein